MNASPGGKAVLEPAKVFEDRESPEDWRVEWIDDDGGCEIAIFSGQNARERAIRYADRQYGNFEGGRPFAVPLDIRRFGSVSVADAAKLAAAREPAELGYRKLRNYRCDTPSGSVKLELARSHADATSKFQAHGPGVILDLLRYQNKSGGWNRVFRKMPPTA